MKNAKCTNCGANIEVNENSEAGVCKYCKSAYITEKAIKNYSSSISNSSTNNANTIVNNYFNGASTQTIQGMHPNIQYVQIAPNRPKVRILLVLLLGCCYIFPAVIYIACVKIKQKKWDKKYKG